MGYLIEYRTTEKFYETYGSRKSDENMLVASREWKNLVSFMDLETSKRETLIIPFIRSPSGSDVFE